MFSIFRRTARPYAKRLPRELVRRAQLSIRVHEKARYAIVALAASRGMSASEYVCRVLNDHLSQVANLHFVVDRHRSRAA